jgi:hypothetical protein
MGWRYFLVVKHLPSIHEALSLAPLHLKTSKENRPLIFAINTLSMFKKCHTGLHVMDILQ